MRADAGSASPSALICAELTFTGIHGSPVVNLACGVASHCTGVRSRLIVRSAKRRRRRPAPTGSSLIDSMSRKSSMPSNEALVNPSPRLVDVRRPAVEVKHRAEELRGELAELGESSPGARKSARLPAERRTW